MMNRKEVLYILGILQTAYPGFYRGQSKEQLEATVRLWERQFAGKDYKLVCAAVEALISTRTETYPPNIGAVNEMISKMADPEITPMEAWGYVRRAMQNGIYGAEYEWECLPESVKASITPEQIRAWAMDEDFNEGVASSNYMRSYAARDKNRRQLTMLTNDVQKLITQAADRLMIGET